MYIKIRDFLRKYNMITFFVGLFIVGIVFLVAGVITFLQPKVEGVKVDAKIVNIERESTGFNSDGVEEFDHHVYVNYTDNDGLEHTNIEAYKYSTTMKVGDVIEIEYNPNNPNEIVSQNKMLDLIFIAVGAACVIFSLVKIVTTVKNKNINEYNKVDMNKVSKEQIESVSSNNEEEKEYYFHFTGKLNQSYVMETPERKPIYEARCDKMGIVSKSDFTFINHLTGKEEKHKVGHTVEQSYNNFLTSSNAKIDNENVWNLIGKEGYSLEPHLDGIKPVFDVYKYGVLVGKIESAGRNILKDDSNSKLGEIPGDGLFRIYCKESDIDKVFLITFIIARVKLN